MKCLRPHYRKIRLARVPAGRLNALYHAWIGLLHKTGFVAYPDHQSLVAGLVESHGQQLRRYLLSRVRNASDVPDIVQEVFLRMMRVPNVESVRSPEAYLFTVAQHVVQQHTLKQSAIPPSADLEQILSERSPGTSFADPSLEVHAEQCLDRLQLGLDRLSPKVRATFLLSRRDGLTFEEIAIELGTTKHMVKKYLMRALTRLRRGLEEAEAVKEETGEDSKSAAQGTPK